MFYLAALAEIIALRFGRPAARVAPQLVPLRTTLEQWRAGAWPFVYHVVGNLTWFMPLGLLCPCCGQARGGGRPFLLGRGFLCWWRGISGCLARARRTWTTCFSTRWGALLGYGLCRLVRRVNVKSCGSA